MKEEIFEWGYGNPIKRTTLENGLRIISQKFPDRCVHLYLATRFGSNNENDEDLGVAHFIEHMLFRGTQNLARLKVIETIDDLGAHGNANTSQDMTRYYLDVQDKHADTAINLLYEMAFNSSFANFETEKEVVLKEIIESKDEVDEVLNDRFHAELYKKHPMKNPVLGTEKTISKLKKERLMKYHSEFYVPNNMVLAVVGEINEEIMKKIKEKFSIPARKTKPSIEKIVEPEQTGKDLTAMLEGLEGAHIMLGTQLRNGEKIISITDPDSYVMFMISEFLTGGLSSKLYRELREKRGMVYGVLSSYEALDDYSEFVVNFTTAKRHYKKAIDIIFSELERLKKEPISEKELDRIKMRLEADYFLTNSDGSERADSFINDELLNKGIEEFVNYIERINAVTSGDMVRVANEYINTKNLVIVKILPENKQK